MVHIWLLLGTNANPPTCWVQMCKEHQQGMRVCACVRVCMQFFEGFPRSPSAARAVEVCCLQHTPLPTPHHRGVAMHALFHVSTPAYAAASAASIAT